MKSFDFKPDRHKLIAHRGIRHLPPPAEQPPVNQHRPHKPDLLDRLINQHPLLHHLELLLPSDAPSFPTFAATPVSYHVSARLTAFLSSSFLLPLLSSGSLAAFTLATPIDRCNTFTLLSTTAAHKSSSAATLTTAATVTLTLDEDTYQQLGLTGQPLAAQPGFHIVTIPIQPSSWQPSSRLYQRVHTCLAAMAEVELIVQHIDSSGQHGGEAHFTAAEGVRLIKRVDNDKQLWQSDQPVALPDVTAVWQAGCNDIEQASMLRQQRKDARQQLDQLDIELVDWIGLTTNHLISLLPTHQPNTTTAPSTALVDNLFCTSLPLLSTTAAAPIASVRYTGLLSHGGVWRSLVEHGWALVGGGGVPWVCVVGSGVVDGGNRSGVDGVGNGENDVCVMLLPGGRYLLYQLANACMPVH